MPNRAARPPHAFQDETKETKSGSSELGRDVTLDLWDQGTQISVTRESCDVGTQIRIVSGRLQQRCVLDTRRRMTWAHTEGLDPEQSATTAYLCFQDSENTRSTDCISQAAWRAMPPGGWFAGLHVVRAWRPVALEK